MNIESRHFVIVQEILSRYSYSFFAFGSRVTAHARKLSDLDLCFFEDIPLQSKLQLEEELEGSDLPYTVDLVPWHACVKEFQNIILQRLVCVQASEKLLKLEECMLSYFKHLPSLLGYKIYKRHATLIACGLGTSMFNIAYGFAQNTQENLDKQIHEIIDVFKKQPFAWWIQPSVDAQVLGERLLQLGFVIDNMEQLMLCDLDKFAHDQAVEQVLQIKQVLDAATLEYFIGIIEVYDTTARSLYKRLNEDMLQANEKLFIGFVKHKPVIIGTLFVWQDIAIIANLITLPEKRKLGYGTEMMHYLIYKAKTMGVKEVMLTASNISGYSIYEKCGFRCMGRFWCFEWRAE